VGSSARDVCIYRSTVPTAARTSRLSCCCRRLGSSLAQVQASVGNTSPILVRPSSRLHFPSVSFTSAEIVQTCPNDDKPSSLVRILPLVLLGIVPVWSVERPATSWGTVLGIYGSGDVRLNPDARCRTHQPIPSPQSFSCYPYVPNRHAKQDHESSFLRAGRLQQLSFQERVKEDTGALSRSYSVLWSNATDFWLVSISGCSSEGRREGVCGTANHTDTEGRYDRKNLTVGTRDG